MDAPSGHQFAPLYDPRFEHDACGIGFVARRDGAPSHEVLRMALGAVGAMTHRGAVAGDGRTGDGAGVLTQLPRDLLARELRKLGHSGETSRIGVGMLFLPTPTLAEARAVVEGAVARQGLTLVAWRVVPVNPDALGDYSRRLMPTIEQVVVESPSELDSEEYERRLYVLRRDIERAALEAKQELYVASLSCRTIVYKGLLAPLQIPEFYDDMRDPDYTTALAIYHQRYSTNTFPTWERAQPFRMLCHNGEINTLQGNVNWMRAREPVLQAPTLGGPEILAPVCDERGSDSAMLDNALELLVRGGRDIRHAMVMLVPEAWERVSDLDPELRAFYQFHACMMEAWDGPAALTFSDGVLVGTTLDRNGLRPARYLITEDGLVISGSEVGAVPIDESRIIRKGRLGPGQMIVVDTARGLILDDTTIKRVLARRKPYRIWVGEHLRQLEDLEIPDPVHEHLNMTQLHATFGYTEEELAVVLKPMAESGYEAVGSMGDDTPHAVLSAFERPLYSYFRQRFAEVTNPPIDPLREGQVMSLGFSLGPRGNLLDERPEQARLVRIPTPILSNNHILALKALDETGFRAKTLSLLWETAGGEESLDAALTRLCADADAAIKGGATLLILSDRGVDQEHAAIPTLLGTGAVHHHLLRTSQRSFVSLIVETGEARDVHHMACLIGYGAEAINPYLGLATARDLAVDRETAKNKGANANNNGHSNGEEGPSYLEAIADAAEVNYRHALERGVLKVMSKMGIATVDSYCGAQIFEALGVDPELVERCFNGTPSPVRGIGLREIARGVLARHARAFGGDVKLTHTGFYKFKKAGEYHAFSPSVVHALQKASRAAGALNGHFADGYAVYREYADLVNNRTPTDLRDLLDFVQGESISVDEVEPIESIVRRFSTAAVSHGAISSESHIAMAVAMNRLGGMSNSGEGGEAEERYGTERNSRIKQVASGRFGVTPAYLASADELQIKMAQGSKPGEGGQIPGQKVSAEIARIRHTVPGVALISPPPHHDIYSIEDLAQLIYDLRQTNPKALVTVKLVAEMGVGTVAAGVAKGYADGILISGHSGGTGASPLSSIKGAGMPWELGLAETQQTLVLNDLRGRVSVRADGGFKTGRDVVVAALLGADEYSFGTAPLVAEGCVMARACHLNTCPVGIATQKPELRAKFDGTPEQVMAFFRYIAQEVREILAQLGFRKLDEVIGRTDLLFQRASELRDGQRLDLSPLLAAPPADDPRPRRFMGKLMVHQPGELNQRILEESQNALETGTPVELEYKVFNHDRTIGALLSWAIAKRNGNKGLPDGTVTIKLKGSAGQSLGAFCGKGIRIMLEGESNDYVGKGLAGAEIVIRPHREARFVAHEQVIMGNTVLYGATGGAVYAAGRAGERFCVRNSGATAVVEGIGDHGCEYMTGGSVVILGPVGRNFGAGMTGGAAYIFDEEQRIQQHLNTELVSAEPLNLEDEARVLELVARHQELTGSARAAEILARWPSVRSLFRRVAPRSTVAAIERANEATDAARR